MHLCSIHCTLPISVVINGLDSFLSLLLLCTNLAFQAPTRNPDVNHGFFNSWSISSLNFLVWAVLSTSRITVTSSEVTDIDVTGLGGQFFSSDSHSGPFHHSSIVFSPLLARSAGLSCVGTCLHWISWF